MPFLYFQESLGGGVYGSVGASGAEGGERREGGKRGRRPGRKAQLDKQDMKAKLGKDFYKLETLQRLREGRF